MRKKFGMSCHHTCSLQNLHPEWLTLINILIIMFNFNKIMAEQPSVALCRLYHRVLWTGFRQSGNFSHRLNANHIL